MSDLPDPVTHNARYWNDRAESFAEAGALAWTQEPHWGLFAVPDATARVLPASVQGLDVVELGCGTAYISAWLARRGAHPVGIDVSEGQLATARRLQAEHGLSFPLHLGNAEQTPFADDSCEHLV